jgi:hypothetical protein
MPKWKTEIEEVSNGVYRLTMTHELGPKIEKTGSNLELLRIELFEVAFKIEKDLESHKFRREM